MAYWRFLRSRDSIFLQASSRREINPDWQKPYMFSWLPFLVELTRWQGRDPGSNTGDMLRIRTDVEG